MLEAIRLLGLDVDILHANDWQTGLVPAYHKIEYRNVPHVRAIASLFTVHNMAYQGMFWHWDMLLTGLDWKYFNWHQMEFFGKLNLLKTGLVFADAINTVSPRYAEEIQSAPAGLRTGRRAAASPRACFRALSTASIIRSGIRQTDPTSAGPIRRRRTCARARRNARRRCSKSSACRATAAARRWSPSSAG